MVMAYAPTGISATPPEPRPITQPKFDRGVISIVGPSKLPLNALAAADNLTLDEDGSPRVRPGSDWYGVAVPNAATLQGGGLFVTSEEAPHIVIVAGGVVYRSVDDAQTWDVCSGGSFTVDKSIQVEQAAGVLYLFDSYDAIVRYDGTTVLTSYQELFKPVGPNVAKTGLASTTFTYYYRISAVNDVGYTMGSFLVDFSGNATSIGVDRVRTSWDDSNYVTLTWTNGLADVNNDGIANGLDLSTMLASTDYAYPSRYDLYVGTAQGEEVYFDSVDVASIAHLSTVTYVDKGQSPQQELLLVPEDNTTVGPKVGDMSQVGTRLYATADKDNPWRVWISAAGRDMGKFSSAFEGTYIDLQKGGQFRPVRVEDYRDGKGTPLATVWCKSIDGRGCVWQGTLDTFTVGDVSFPVPNFYKLPGSRGTNAPNSVVNVLNEYMYYNSQAFYNLGSRAQFLNLLSTDEASANIRPDVRSINLTAAENIASFFFEAKVYFSVPSNSTTNNRIIVFDTERKAWLPNAYSFGVERFFQYTDIAGLQHLLCWKSGDTRLTEISRSIKGDYGMAFATALQTGLVHVNPKNRFDFLWIEEGEFELSQPSGYITVELSGITREDGYQEIGTAIVTPTTLGLSWSHGAWTTHAWSNSSANAAITNYSEPSTKRYFNVQRDVNAYQYRITTNDLDADYVLRTLQINGTDTDAGKPREWEILS